jgi:hypothetical protein
MSQYVEPGSQVRLFVEQVHPRLVLNFVEGDILPHSDDPDEAAPSTPKSTTAQADSRTASTATQADSRTAATSTAITGNVPHNAILARILDLPTLNAVRLQILPHPDEPARAYISKDGATLFPGQLLNAKLVQTDSTTSLRPGQELFFQIARSTPNLVLQIDHSIQARDTGKSSLIQAATHYLNSPQSVAQAASEIQSMTVDKSQVPPDILIRYEALRTLVNALSPDGSKTDFQFLDRVSALLGLAGDRPELRDEIARLITNLAKSEIFKDHVDHPVLRVLAETSARLFEAIEHMHGLNREGIRQEQTLLIPFPLFWDAAKGGGEIRLAWSGEESSSDGEGAPFRITVLLDLTRLGKIKADVELRGKVMRAVFWTESSRAQTVLAQSFNHFQNALDAWGVKVESLLARVYPKEQRMPDSLAEEIIAGSSLVNLRV